MELTKYVATKGSPRPIDVVHGTIVALLREGVLTDRFHKEILAFLPPHEWAVINGWLITQAR